MVSPCFLWVTLGQAALGLPVLVWVERNLDTSLPRAFSWYEVLASGILCPLWVECEGVYILALLIVTAARLPGAFGTMRASHGRKSG